MTKNLLALWLAACAPATSATLSSLSQAPSCSAATPDDDQDDTLAVQAAIDGRCCLGPGVHDIDMPPVGKSGRRRYETLRVTTGELCGAGPTTVLRFRGDAGRQDWRGIEQTGGTIRDLTLDTSLLVGTSEQTHAVHALGPASGAVQRVTFNHPQRGMDGGDCIDLVGYSPDRLVTGFTVRDNDFRHCDRGGVQAHSGTVGLVIDRNTFSDTGDFDIDSEGSGGNSDWTITRNVMAASPGNQGAYSVALDLVDGVTMAGNALARGLWLYGCTHCEISRNEISYASGRGTGGAVVEAIKGSNDLTIADNRITRPVGRDPGPLLHIGPHGTERSLDVRVIHNEMVQETAADVVYVEGLAGLRMDDNKASYAGPAGSSAVGLRALGSGGEQASPATGISLVHNAFTGPLRSTVSVAGAAGRAGIGSVYAAWNTSDAPGLACANLWGVAGPITLAYDAWAAGSCGVPSLAVTIP